MGGRIVVGVDGSETSQRALAFAVEEAKRRGAELEAVIAYRWVAYYPGLEFAMVPPQSRAKVEVEALAVLLEAVAHLPADQQPETVAVEGSASSALLERAEGADLLVVGSRGHGGFTGLLLGSTSHQVVSHAPCPVVVVP